MYDGKLVKQLNDDFETIAPLSLLYEDNCPKEILKNVTKRIREFYLGDRPVDETTRFNVIDVSKSCTSRINIPIII